MLTSDILSGIAEKAKESNPILEDDFKENGIWMCGKCLEPKECKIDIDGNAIIVRCLCRCGRKKRKLAEEAAERKKLNEVNLERLKGYTDMTFDKANDTHAMRFARKYVEKWDDILHTRSSFTLSGGTGCGKTFACACIANAIADKNLRVWMATSSAMVDMMFDQSEKVLNRLRNFELVIIDDFGAERNTEYGAQKIFEIIDTRARADLPTIITTNLDLKQEAPSLAYQRIYSRLEFAPQFRVNGEDIRKKNGEERRKLINELMKE